MLLVEWCGDHHTIILRSDDAGFRCLQGASGKDCLMASKNQPTIDHLKLACRHIDEMMEAGITENIAIRTLELLSDVYAKLHQGGAATPHHADQVKLWSVAARKMRTANKKANAKAGTYLRVEHGTPRRVFARKIMVLHHASKLNTRTMNNLVRRYWKLAVITLEEDARLAKSAPRSTMFDTPELRWATAGIVF
jgi:hypothetical protein